MLYWYLITTPVWLTGNFVRLVNLTTVFKQSTDHKFAWLDDTKARPLAFKHFGIDRGIREHYNEANSWGYLITFISFCLVIVELIDWCCWFVFFIIGQFHRDHDNMEYYLQLEIWKGNISGVLRLAREQEELSDWLVAMAPMGEFLT